MTAFKFVHPREFQKPRYVNATLALEKEFGDKFGKLNFITVELRIIWPINNEAFNYTILPISQDTAFISIPFARFINGNIATELPDEENFYQYLKTMFLKILRENEL